MGNKLVATLRFAFKYLLIVVLCEVVTHYLLQSFEWPFSAVTESVLDAIIISVLSIGPLYYFVINPLSRKDRDILNSVTHSMSEGLVVQNREGHIIRFNQAALKILGLTEDQLFGRTSLDPRWRSITEKYEPLSGDQHPAMTVLRTGHPVFGFVMGVETPNAELRWIMINALPLDRNESGNIESVLSTFTDITDQKRTSVTYELLYEGINRAALVSITDAKGRIFFANDTFCKRSQYSKEELLGKDHRILNSAYHDDTFFKNMWETINSGKIWRGEVCNRAKDGTYYWVDSTIAPIVDHAGKIEKFVSIRVDITDRKELDHKLVQLNALNSAILESAKYSIIATSVDGLILHFNPEAERILGYRASEVIGKQNPGIFHDPQEVVSHARKLSQEYNQDVPVGFETFVFKTKDGLADVNEWTYIHKNGRRTPVLLTVTALRDKDGNITGYLGIAEDLTERKNLEKKIETEQMKMIQSSRMASLGEMAGGIAHEINNPLAVIRGKSQQLRLGIERDSLTREQLMSLADSIEQTVVRIAKIISGLRSFSRDSAQDPFVMTSVSHIISETLSFCESRLKNSGVSISVFIDDESAGVECRSSQISQVLLNLINNANDAIQNLQEKWIRVSVVSSLDRIQIRVMDSGPGIPLEIQEKIFQPFFSTKELGKGTGLGLSISAGILKSHHGSFYVDNSEGHTCFVVDLPKTQIQGLAKSA